MKSQVKQEEHKSWWRLTLPKSFSVVSSREIPRKAQPNTLKAQLISGKMNIDEVNNENYCMRPMRYYTRSSFTHACNWSVGKEHSMRESRLSLQNNVLWIFLPLFFMRLLVFEGKSARAQVKTDWKTPAKRNSSHEPMPNETWRWTTKKKSCCGQKFIVKCSLLRGLCKAKHLQFKTSNWVSSNKAQSLFCFIVTELALLSASSKILHTFTFFFLSYCRLNSPKNQFSMAIYFFHFYLSTSSLLFFLSRSPKNKCKLLV